MSGSTSYTKKQAKEKTDLTIDSRNAIQYPSDRAWFFERMSTRSSRSAQSNSVSTGRNEGAIRNRRILNGAVGDWTSKPRTDAESARNFRIPDKASAWANCGIWWRLRLMLNFLLCFYTFCNISIDFFRS